MARLASISVGGYYKTPEALLPLIAGLLACPDGGHCFLDPCAGKGEAIFTLAEALNRRTVVSIEMEATRFKDLQTTAQAKGGYVSCRMALHGDAFRARLTRSVRNAGATLLYLNPPYDLDPVCGRLEERFLRRFTEALAPGGVLVFVVPFYALKASAETLATKYTGLQCFRFPGEHFATFKQVVLVAERTMTGHLNPDVRAQVEAWAAGGDMPELGTTEAPVITVLPRSGAGFETVIMDRVDLSTLTAAFRPWGVSDKAGRTTLIEGVVPTEQVRDLLDRRYPLAMPPKAQHIATGIAAGIFNGAVIGPDDPESHLPKLLIKGCFDKEWRKVEEKTNKKGEVTAEVQIQAPKLVVTVLDLQAKTYHTLSSSPSPTMTRTVAQMSTGDLIAHYGEALMRVLLKQCPVSYDPADVTQHFPLPTLGRPLFKAQEHVVRAAVTLLGGPSLPLARRHHRSAFILGEIGSGKSIIALGTLEAIGAKSSLILCPPHLLDSWKEQVSLTVKDARCSVLTTVEDVIAYAADRTPGRRIAILSRETAKLGHAMEGVSRRCPACHSALGEEPEELAKKRMVCGHRPLLALDDVAKLSQQIARQTYLLAPTLLSYAGGAARRRVNTKAPTKEAQAAQWAGLERSGLLIEALIKIAQMVPGAYDVLEKMGQAAVALGLSLRDEETRERAARMLWGAGVAGAYWLKQAAVSLMLSLDPSRAPDLVAFLRSVPDAGYYATSSWLMVERAFDDKANGRPLQARGGHDTGFLAKWTLKDGAWQWGGKDPLSAEMLVEGFLLFRGLGQWERGEECGETLYQSSPDSFRRVPLADFIAKRYRTAFDSLVLDEIQEYASEGSAQERAAHLLTEVGWPMLMLTGTVSNGYASSLFTNTWATDRAFRQEFDRDEVTAFMDRYGYRKRLVQDKDEKGEVVAFGTHTDRVERSTRMTGYAPGVLPLFIYRYLLKRACVIHKTDARADIPPMVEERVDITPTAAQHSAYSRLLRDLVGQMQKDQFSERSGKLFGALSELPSYLDRCPGGVGNQEEGTYEIRYPAEIGGGVVSTGDATDPLDLLPKEQWMLDQLRRDLAAGENVILLVWHTNLLARYKWMIERESGVDAPILDPAKVPTAKRQGWIEKEIVKKNRRVLLCNPTTIQTGLNNLVHFSRIYVMENPACNPITYRQVIGRIDRIGQTRPTRVYLPVYRSTLQGALYKLLLLKVAVSRATDGLDAEGALVAAGVGEGDAMASLSVGRALAEWIKQRPELAA
jgi:SAM-dependent methyltransferase